MLTKYFPIIALTLFFFGPQVLAGKTQLDVDIEIENAAYTIPTRLEGLIIYENGENQQEFKIKIPPKNNETNVSLTENIFIKPMVSKITYLLLNEENPNEEDDSERTILGFEDFSPTNPVVKSLKLILTGDNIIASATY